METKTNKLEKTAGRITAEEIRKISEGSGINRYYRDMKKGYQDLKNGISIDNSSHVPPEAYNISNYFF